MSSIDETISRKVQLSGGSTFTVSLPKEWASNNGIDAGDEVYLSPYRNGSLVLSTDATTADSRRTVPVVDHAAEDLRHLVSALYLTGSDTVTFDVADADAAAVEQAISDAGRTLFGFELVSAAGGEVALQNLVREDHVSLSQSLLKIQYVALSMQKDAVRALATADASTAERVHERKDDVDEGFALVERHVQRSLTDLDVLDGLGCTRAEAFDCYVVARQLERVADHAVRIASVAASLDDAPDEDLLADLRGCARRSRDLLEAAVDAMLEVTTGEAPYHLFDQGDDVVAAIAALDERLRRAESEEAYLLGQALDGVRRTAECAANVAERAVHRTVRESY